MHKRDNRTLTPVWAFRLQVAILAVSLLVAVVGVLLAADTLDSEVSATAAQSRNVLLLTGGDSRLGDMLAIISPRSSTYLGSDSYLAMDPESQRAVRTELLRTDLGPPDASLPPTDIALSLKDGIALQKGMDSLLESTAPALASREDPDTLRIRVEVASAIKALQVYFEQPTVSNFRLLRSNLTVLRDEARLFFPTVAGSADKSFANLQNRVSTGRIAVIIGIVAIGGNAFFVTILMGRRLQKAVQAAESEQKSLTYRNNQLNALYAVFSEITDNLSLHYVVEATVRESQRLVNAHAVVLRLVRQDELVVQGSLDDHGLAIEGLETIELGEGPVGRVARRGKTMRLAENASASGEREGADGNAMQSGLVVPLIVGARVVGTLACWSRERNAFSDDDQRVMEMMASQVATAVAAADSTEIYHRRSRLDTLTGLSNRRELDEDIRGFLAEIAESGRKATVAMTDIDHFKRFNDDYGHHVGDVTLQKVAAVMKSSLRESDRVYRYGGEEFVMVFVDADRDLGLMLAERMRAAVESTPLTGDSLEPVGPVTISIGLALFPDQSNDFGVLIQLADEAMYRSKETGRNRVTLWSPPVLETAAA